MNPETHTTESFRDLADSVRERGCLAPIFMDPKVGKILDGHHRAEILRGMGIPMEEWPIIWWPEHEMIEQRQQVEKYFREMYIKLTE